MPKQLLLIAVAVVCLALYFYGSQIKKDNEYIKYLPVIGSLAFGLNTLVQLAQSEEQKPVQPSTTHQRPKTL
jgi:hypothetical protein